MVIKESLAIITARGGSKRIPGKNVKSFIGRPIISYPISAAISSGCFDEIMVSTDDTGIAEVAANEGATVPFLRSAQNADDYATTAAVVKEVLSAYHAAQIRFRHFCCIYPTAVFITPERLRMAYDILKNDDANAVVSVCAFGHNIFRSLKIENGGLAFQWPEYSQVRSQDLPSSYYDCGQFYFLKTDAFLENPVLFQPKAKPIEVPESETQDIDTAEDWKIAEMKYRIKYGI